MTLGGEFTGGESSWRRDDRLVSAVFYIHIVNYRDAFGLVRLIFFADRVINILTQVGFPEDET